MRATIRYVVKGEASHVSRDPFFRTDAVLEADDVELDILNTVHAKEELNRLDETSRVLCSWRKLTDFYGRYPVWKRDSVCIY